MIKNVQKLGFQWPTQDPFLFLAHHEDAYPRGDGNMGINSSETASRQRGNDFDLSKPWKMYHGSKVPGFPVHPHRGFETVTLVLDGYVDHFDSSGGCGRYGAGDVQWMTAGSGLQHSEMFPLLKTDGINTLHLFQIWLNLPSERKFCSPFYKMLWREKIPRIVEKGMTLTLIAGSYKGWVADSPAPDSWANYAENCVDIWLVELEPGASLDLIPKVVPNRVDLDLAGTLNRSLYFYKGSKLSMKSLTKSLTEDLGSGYFYALDTEPVQIQALDEKASCLILSAVAIGEPVAQYGPFVMTTKDEIRQAYEDYQNTHFGGWPWKSNEPVLDASEGRIAKYAEGKVSKP